VENDYGKEKSECMMLIVSFSLPSIPSYPLHIRLIMHMNRQTRDGLVRRAPCVACYEIAMDDNSTIVECCVRMDPRVKRRRLLTALWRIHIFLSIAFPVSRKNRYYVNWNSPWSCSVRIILKKNDNILSYECDHSLSE
jgi:hypothetical protein